MENSSSLCHLHADKSVGRTVLWDTNKHGDEGRDDDDDNDDDALASSTCAIIFSPPS